MGGGGSIGNGAETILDVGCAERGWRRKSASGGRNAQERLALFAERRHAELVGAACFVIEQNSLEDGLHISPHPRTIVVEGLHYAIEVSCTRLAGDQPLNEL